MADFEIDVGFNTRELEQLTGAGIGRGTGQPQFNETQSKNTIGAGVVQGLKFAGVTATLASIQLVMDTVSFFLGIISTTIGFVATMIFENLVPFFKDPVRAFLELGIFIINGIISGIEFLTNAILGIFGGDPVELPRFQSDIILEGYDKMQEVFENANATAEQIEEAQRNFGRSFTEAFLTQEEYAALRAKAEENQQSLFESLIGVEQTGEALDKFVTESSETAVKTADSAFTGLGKLFDLMNQKVEELSKKLGGMKNTIEAPTLRQFREMAPSGQPTEFMAELIRRNTNKNLNFTK